MPMVNRPDPPKPTMAEWLMLPVFAVGVIALCVGCPLGLAYSPRWLQMVVLGLSVVGTAFVAGALTYGLWWQWRQTRASRKDNDGDKEVPRAVPQVSREKNGSEKDQ